MHLLPVPCDVDTAAEPDPLGAPHIIEEFYQARGARRATDQTVVQADGHQPGMLGALSIKEVEGIPHVPIKIVGVCKAMALIAAVVVGFVGIGNNQMRLAGDVKRPKPPSKCGEGALGVEEIQEVSAVPECPDRTQAATNW